MRLGPEPPTWGDLAVEALIWIAAIALVVGFLVRVLPVVL